MIPYGPQQSAVQQQLQQLRNVKLCYVCDDIADAKVETTRAAIPVCKHCLLKRIPRDER